MLLKSNGKFEIPVRGTVYGVNLEENNLPSVRSELNDLMLGKEVELQLGDLPSQTFKVLGIEMLQSPDGSSHKNIGLVVRPPKNYGQ